MNLVLRTKPETKVLWLKLLNKPSKVLEEITTVNFWNLPRVKMNKGNLIHLFRVPL